jgi:hypothetical protein
MNAELSAVLGRATHPALERAVARVLGVAVQKLATHCQHLIFALQGIRLGNLQQVSIG